MKKEQDMQKTIDALRKAGEEMGNEIVSLKRQIGGYKSANERYRKDLENLKKREKEERDEILRLYDELKKAKAYGKEADELNEQKAQRIATLNDALSTAREQISAASQKNKDLCDENRVLQEKIYLYNNLPWYKKIFVKTI